MITQDLKSYLPVNGKKFKNIILITTQDGEEGANNRKEFLNDPRIKERRQKGDPVVFAYGGSDNTTIDIDEDRIFHLKLNVKEGYTNLARKSIEAIKFCVKNYRFERLYKCDDTKLIGDHCDFEHIHKQDFLGCTASGQKREGSRTWCTGTTPAMSPCSRRDFKKWASRRDIWIDQGKYDQEVWYSNWKPYAISYKFAKLISEVGDRYADLYVDFLGGCEDHMIGKIWKDLSIGFNLTMR